MRKQTTRVSTRTWQLLEEIKSQAPSRSLDLISLEKEMTCLKFSLAESIEIFNVSNRKPKMCFCWTVETLGGRSSAEFSSLAGVAFYHSGQAMAGSFS